MIASAVFFSSTESRPLPSSSLDVKSVRLMPNNPNKVRQLQEHGIQVSARVPHLLPPTEHNRAYLETKARRSGHFIELPRARVSEQHDDVELDETSGAADPA